MTTNTRIIVIISSRVNILVLLEGAPRRMVKGFLSGGYDCGAALGGG
jgi:hypothetical protein